jgi:hypothetical protein
VTVKGLIGIDIIAGLVQEAQRLQDEHEIRICEAFTAPQIARLARPIIERYGLRFTILRDRVKFKGREFVKIQYELPEKPIFAPQEQKPVPKIDRRKP